MKLRRVGWPQGWGRRVRPPFRARVMEIVPDGSITAELWESWEWWQLLLYRRWNRFVAECSMVEV